MISKHPLIPILKTVDKSSCPEILNFHCHTKYSDGSLTPFELYKQASVNGLKHLAITDHHSFNAYIDIINSNDINDNKETTIWSGMEISGILKGCMVHILALGFDIDSSYLNSYARGDAVRGELLDANKIIKNIKKANGLSILAHPARYKLSFKELILEAKLVGFDGVEVWYDYNRSSDWKYSSFICEEVKRITDKYSLLSTCGTDTHGLSILKR